MNKIYCFLQSWHGDKSDPRDVVVTALADDGNVVGGHYSSNLGFAKRDIGHLPGTFQESCHAKFAERFPDGFETEWVDDPDSHEAFQAAFALNQQMAPDDKGCAQ